MVLLTCAKILKAGHRLSAPKISKLRLSSHHSPAHPPTDTRTPHRYAKSQHDVGRTLASECTVSGWRGYAHSYFTLLLSLSDSRSSPFSCSVCLHHVPSCECPSSCAPAYRHAHPAAAPAGAARTRTATERGQHRSAHSRGTAAAGCAHLECTRQRGTHHPHTRGGHTTGKHTRAGNWDSGRQLTRGFALVCVLCRR